MSTTATFTSNALSSTAAKRLYRDFAELKQSPVARANAEPLNQENLFLWHGNLLGLKGPFAVTPLHFTLEFPENYPTAPPKVLLCSPLPHPNVSAAPKRPGFHRICLDMLETGAYADPSTHSNGTFPYSGWSSSYTVRSIMMQLQTFLLDTHAGQSERVLVASNHAARYECPECSHSPPRDGTGGWWPVAAESVSETSEPVYVERPFVKDLLEQAAVRRMRKGEAASLASARVMAEDEPEWVVCGSKKEGVLNVAAFGEKSGDLASPFLSKSMFSILEDVQEWDAAAVTKNQAAPSAEPASALKVNSTAFKTKPVAKTVEALATPKLTKTAIKNAKRNEKRRLTKYFNPTLPVSQEIIEEDFTVQVPDKPEEAPQEDVVSLTSKIGHFASVPYELLLQILNMLPVQAIMVLSQSCKFFNTATEDGYLWKHLYSSLDAKLELKAASLGDWKHVYRMQMMGVVEDLRCFHRKVSFKEDILGIPIEFTVNPVKKTIDYMHSTMELLSASAFRVDQVRKTVWSEAFSEWLPLYLSYDHFQRSLPLLKKSFVRLCPHLKCRGFDPITVLETLPKLMNTQLVLLCDSGLHNSDAFLSNYFQIHRLFLAMIYEYPQLKTAILSKLKTFAKLPSKRTKEAVASLGDLVPIISVLGDPLAAWANVGPLILKESMERAVLWICRQTPSLAKLAPITKGGVEEERIQESFAGSAVSLKLMAAHVAMFKAISRAGGTVQLAKSHDLFYGRPPAHFLSRLKTDMSLILASNSYKDIVPHFQLPRLPFACPTYSPAKMTECLRHCVRQSLAKGYHSRNTDFSKIHKSGVSKILRKGQSYRCAPNIKKIVMEESWGRGGLSQYLDATVLAYDFSGKFIDLVDYSHTSGQNGALQHSGDIITADRGSHKVNISTAKLSKTVKTLVVAMTSWTTTLANILTPEVRLFDGESMTELCQYSFDECARAGDKTCVIMCTLQREREGAVWAVKALGKICKGTAMDYDPVKQFITRERLV
ncbi:hypothetical protein CcCBS67573_g01316 [Chytriomyces confervae]|uniref:UBC core domain-containing protein n=1 Tax=Chytriomyces confervae TaxID=246404 RepID=A0A507FMG5_9FUNG|nr:hypothetical protein HDU80_003424 [Chytriomyces hyalinus]TPX77443.1 hypothetical protein CcCBS67573_g01316 [Chytriomyces confervae]